MKTAFYTLLALVAFAGNSVLCRLALGEDKLDAASFTAIRLFSGIVVLVLILLISQRNKTIASKGSWSASLMLFIYAITFSYAYISLETGVGALILFACVQITMILVGLFLGDKLHSIEWLGVIVAFIGFVYLVMPGVSAPSFSGFVLMSVSGIAWAGYTLLGKNSSNPLSDTTFNFLRTSPFLILLIAVTAQNASLSNTGIFLAIISGGITSGLGYTIWYKVLKDLKSIQAAVLQLLVPVLATFGGIIFANESFSLRLAVSTMMILGGIVAVILGKNYIHQKSTV